MNMLQAQKIREKLDLGNTVVGADGMALLVIVSDGYKRQVFEPEIPFNTDYCMAVGISLNELKNQIEKKYPNFGEIVCISEYGTSGKLFRYGNHGSFWEETGTTKGYA